MAATGATLGGVPVLASSVELWPIRAGVAPVVEEFDVAPQYLEGLLKTIKEDRPVEYVVNDGGRVHTFRDLYVIREDPSARPQIKRVLVADRRWKWPFQHILRRYNIRRRTGTVRRGEWNRRLQPGPVFTFQFAQFSLQAFNRPWTATAVLKDILETLGERGFQIDKDIDALDKLPIEDEELDDTGDQALARALKFIPGTQVVIEPDGKLRVFSALSGKEVGVVGDGEIGTKSLAGPEIVDGGHIEMVTENRMRPRAVEVLFSYEVEFRADFIEGQPAQEGDPLNPPRRLDNVLDIPDFSLKLRDGRTAATGTWIEIGEVLQAWRGVPGRGSIVRITDEIIRVAFMPHLGHIWQQLELLGQFDVIGPDAEWSGRVASLRRNYRQTFRLSSFWMDRFLGIKDYLVATIDVTSGQRAPAMAYSDHALKPSAKALLRSLVGGALQAGRAVPYAWNVNGYPSRNGKIAFGDIPAPARVQILDSDQGIIRLNYLVDPFGLEDMVFPSRIENPGQRNWRRNQRTQPFSFNALSANGKVAQLAPDHRVAILFTVVPSSPNSIKQLYPIRVEAKEVAGLLPDGARRGLNQAFGPVKQVRVGASIETARVAWNDNATGVIQKIFGVGGELANPRDELGDLVVNDVPQGFIGDRAASLPAIAKAVAASVYAEEHARVYGSRSTRMTSGLRLEGSMTEVNHQVRPDGSAVSVISMAPDVPNLDFFAFLDPTTRQVILRGVQPL